MKCVQVAPLARCEVSRRCVERKYEQNILLVHEHHGAHHSCSHMVIIIHGKSTTLSVVVAVNETAVAPA